MSYAAGGGGGGPRRQAVEGGAATTGGSMASTRAFATQQRATKLDADQEEGGHAEH